MPRAWSCLEGHGAFSQSQLMAISDRLGFDRLHCPVCIGMCAIGQSNSFAWMRPATSAEIADLNSPAARAA